MYDCSSKDNSENDYRDPSEGNTARTPTHTITDMRARTQNNEKVLQCNWPILIRRSKTYTAENARSQLS